MFYGKRERKRARQGNSEDGTPGVTQPQFPFSSQHLGYLSNTWRLHTCKGALWCDAAQTPLNYVNEIIYLGSNTTLGTAGSVS